MLLSNIDPQTALEGSTKVQPCLTLFWLTNLVRPEDSSRRQ